MESFKSLELLRVFNWRLATPGKKSKTSVVLKNTAQKSKSQQSGHLNKPLFR